MRHPWALTLSVALWLPAASVADATALPRIGPAPQFALTAQDGRAIALGDLRGKVVVLDFIFTACTDQCPLQTEKLASLQAPLGRDFGTRVVFLSIGLDPQRDTPAALADYAMRHRANLAGWTFLTGGAGEIRRIRRGYGVAASAPGDGTISHNALTSVIDAAGVLRVQYAGTRYRPQELLSDIRRLLGERSGP
jgi:protein SCO1/2